MPKYNYIILGSYFDFYKCAYADIISLTNVRYIDRPITDVTNKLVRLLHKIHNLPQLNSKINLPYRDIWFKKYINQSFTEKRPIVFIIFADWCCWNNRLIEYISEKYPEAKKVLIYNDLVHTKIDLYTKKPLDIRQLKNQFNLIISFDIGDAKNYQIEYYPIPYSSPKNDLDQDKEYESDIYFLGQAKNRLSEIIETFRYLKSLGLKTNFIIAGVKRQDQIYEAGIRYIGKNGVSYSENLKYIENTKCILEIMQKGGSGYTSRTLEAICYGKKLLTNNKRILEAPFYNNEYISYYNSPESINKKFLLNLKEDIFVDYKYKEKISPLRLLEFIESKI